MATNQQLLIALGVLLALLVGALLWALRRWWRSWRARRRGRYAHRREVDARALLEREGFVVEGAQVRRSWTVACDGQKHRIDLRADYLVRRGRQRYVADVKTGERAARITTAATRRQLLEYFIAYDVSGVLLIDMNDELVREVTFPLS